MSKVPEQAVITRITGSEFANLGIGIVNRLREIVFHPLANGTPCLLCAQKHRHIRCNIRCKHVSRLYRTQCTTGHRHCPHHLTTRHHYSSDTNLSRTPP